MADEQILVLDVGHGNCTVIRNEDYAIVVDAGPKNALLEFVTREGITHLELVLISHADADHIAGLLALLSSQEISVGHVRLNTDSIKSSKIWDDLLIVLNDLDATNKVDFQVNLVSGSKETFGCGHIQIEVLAPSKYLAAKGPGSTDKQDRKITSNTISAIIRLVRDGKPILLLPGDLDYVGLQNVNEDGISIEAETLVFPHHGGTPGSGDTDEFTDEIIQKVSPRNVIFSIGRGKHANPRPGIVARILEVAPDTRFVCTQLSEHCCAAIPQKSPDYLGGIYSAGMESNKCCGGSIEIDPEDGAIAKPETAQHADYLDGVVSNALCRK